MYLNPNNYEGMFMKTNKVYIHVVERKLLRYLSHTVVTCVCVCMSVLKPFVTFVICIVM